MSIDWNSVFVPTIGISEVVVRGSIMYLGLFVILRFMARRQAGQFGPADLLVIVLIADAAQNGARHDDCRLGIFAGLGRLAVSVRTAAAQSAFADVDPGR
jgi:uncharacterized membrane protein YcaP (DUF421 family)